MKIITALLLFIFYNNVANACYAMPESLARPATDVIREAKQIYWVQVVGALPQEQPDIGDGGIHVRFVLDVIEFLKGSQANRRIILNGSVDGSHFISSTLDNHRNVKENDFKYGNSGVNANCTRAMPALVLGAKYVIFMGGQPDTKDFERVESNEDEWLKFIRSELNTRK